MSENELTAADKALTEKNLRLTSQFVEEYLADPERFAAWPERTMLVLLPPDDQPDESLSIANTEMAEELRQHGQNPVVWTVGAPRLPEPETLVYWPIATQDTQQIIYDRPRDVLTVIFTKTERPTMPVRINSFIIAQADPETRRVVSFTVPNFSSTATRSAALFDLVFLRRTALIGTTREEMRRLRNELFHEAPPRSENTSTLQALDELFRQSA
jgi:hypothetical protein